LRIEDSLQLAAGSFNESDLTGGTVLPIPDEILKSFNALME